MFRRHLLITFAFSLFVLSAASTVSAQWGPPSRPQPGFDEGYQRGVRAGADDMRRGDTFNFSDENDYRRGDAGYRPQYGDRDWYRDSFRRGFQSGYRNSYQRGGPSRGWGSGRAGGRVDVAVQQGYNDGYEAGLDAAGDRDRFDPVREGRYRSADRGYERAYGDREYYKTNYRSGFRSGYESGYRDGSRYSSRW